MQLTDQRMEQLILKKLLEHDNKYFTVISEWFDKRWFDDKYLQIGIEYTLKYFQKYGNRPSQKILKLLFEKHEEAHPNDVTPGHLARTLDSALSQEFAEFTPEFIEENIVTFIKNKSIYFSITDNFDAITTDHDVSKCLDVFQKVDGLSFNTDIGMNYFDDWEEHKDYLTQPTAKISTGWKGLDDVTYGGLLKDGKCLVVPIAQAGLGKSLFLSNLATNLLHDGRNVLIVSLEMSEDLYAMRIDSHISGVDINCLDHNIEGVKSKVYEFKNAHANANLIIKEFPPDSLNCNQLKAYIDRLILNDLKPDVIMVDYISLMKTNEKSDGEIMYTRVGNIAKQLRALSYHFEVPFIAPQQINGEGYDATNISMSNMSESKAINHHADMIGALYREEGGIEANKINMVVLKNRLGGRLGEIIEWHIDYENVSLRMTDWDSQVRANIEPLRIEEKNADSRSIEDDILSEIENI